MTLDVKVKPRSSQNKILKNPDGTYTVFLTASPVKGLANKSLTCLLSERFGISKSCIKIIKGVNSRHKIISIGGE